MVSQDVVTGQSVIDQILRFLDITAGHQGAASSLAGWLDPAMLGLGGDTMMPTLAREMYDREREMAERNYALDVARLGVAQAQLNFQQRIAAADTKLKELALLASQRGPGNAIAYNYALRNLSAPEGTQVSPFQTSAGINQPVNISMPSFSPTQAPTLPPSIPPAIPPVIQQPQAAPSAAAGPVVASAAPGTSDAELQRILSEHMKQYATPTSAPAATAAPTAMAAGGVAGGNPDGRMLMLGDDERGRTGHEELLLNPTNAPVGVVPPEAVSDEMVANAQSGGKPTPEEILMLIGQLIESLDIDGGGTPAPSPGGSMMPPMMAAQDGGIFGTTLYSGEDIARQPALQAIAGNMNLPAFGVSGLNMQMPGSQTTIPMGHQANIQQVSRMLPSEVQQLQGAIETPREMGGLGLVFGDWLQSMMRAAPVGRSFGAAAYG